MSDLSGTLNQLKAADTRKAVIENKHIVTIVAGKFQQRRITIRTKIDPPMFSAQDVPDDLGDHIVIFDVQD